jgi:hypothetical protein
MGSSIYDRRRKDRSLRGHHRPDGQYHDRHLQPSGPDAKNALSELFELLDGPELRDLRST